MNSKLSKSELFENRIKCNNLKEEIKKDNEIFINDVYFKKVDDVFYSPEKKSCLYVILYHNFGSNSKLLEGYGLYDYFTKTYIDNCNYGKNSKDDYNVVEFWDKVKQLKGE